MSPGVAPLSLGPTEVGRPLGARCPLALGLGRAPNNSVSGSRGERIPTGHRNEEEGSFPGASLLCVPNPAGTPLGVSWAS